MDPIFRFYASPSYERIGAVQGGRGRAASRSIPVYEGYGFLSSLANRVLYPVLRSAGRELLERGLNYLPGSEPQNERKRGAGFGFGAEEEEIFDGARPPKRKRSKRRVRHAISKRKGSKGRKKKSLFHHSGRGGALTRKRRRVTKRKRGKARASKDLFRLFEKK